MGKIAPLRAGYRVWLGAVSVADQIYARFLNLYFVVTALKFYYRFGF